MCGLPLTAKTQLQKRTQRELLDIVSLTLIGNYLLLSSYINTKLQIIRGSREVILTHLSKNIIITLNATSKKVNEHAQLANKNC